MRSNIISKKSVLVLASLFISIVLSFIVRAENPLMKIFTPFAGFDVAGLYMNEAYRYFIDFALFLIFFIGISMFALRKRFSGRGGKSAIIVVGIALAISFAVWEKTAGFHLGKLGPIAAFILVLFIAFAVFQIITNMGMHKPLAIIMAFLVTYYTARAIIPDVFGFLEKNELMASLIALALLILWFMAIWLIIRHLIDAIRGGRRAEEGPPEGEGEEELERREQDRQPRLDNVVINIRSPEHGARFKLGQNIVFAADIAGGIAPYSWVLHSNINDRLAVRQNTNDHRIIVNESRLSLGAHRITFWAGDTQRTTAQEQIEIFVEREGERAEEGEAEPGQFRIEVIEPKPSEEARRFKPTDDILFKVRIHGGTSPYIWYVLAAEETTKKAFGLNSGRGENNIIEFNKKIPEKGTYTVAFIVVDSRRKQTVKQFKITISEGGEVAETPLGEVTCDLPDWQEIPETKTDASLVYEMLGKSSPFDKYNDGWSKTIQCYEKIKEYHKIKGGDDLSKKIKDIEGIIGESVHSIKKLQEIFPKIIEIIAELGVNPRTPLRMVEGLVETYKKNDASYKLFVELRKEYNKLAKNMKAVTEIMAEVLKSISG